MWATSIDDRDRRALFQMLACNALVVLKERKEGATYLPSGTCCETTEL
jgi:hypothetical protein